MNNLSIGSVYQAPLKSLAQKTQKETGSFDQIIKSAIANVDGMGQKADNAIVDMVQGNADVPSTMIEVQKFDISMQLLLAMRNKAIDAYKEVSRMQF